MTSLHERLRRLESERPAGADLLRLAAFWGRGPLPEALLRAGGLVCPDLGAALTPAGGGPEALAEALRCDGLLAAEAGAGLRLAGGVAEAVRDALAGSARRRWLELAARALGLVFPDPEGGRPGLIAALTPHVLALGEHLAAIPTPDPDSEVLLGRAARAALRRAQPEVAVRLAEMGLAQAERARGVLHPAVAGHLDVLAAARRVLGDDQGAEALLVRALDIRERILGPDHPDLVTSLNGLGLLLAALGRADRGEAALRRALRILERAGGLEHPAAGVCLGNLALLLRDSGRAGEALEAARRALAVDEAALGPGHPDVATDLGNLALVHDDLGQTGPAVACLERALAIRARVLGPDHPLTAQVLCRLALALEAAGRRDEAAETLTRGLDAYAAWLRAGGGGGAVAGYFSFLEQAGQPRYAELLRPFRRRLDDLLEPVRGPRQ